MNAKGENVTKELVEEREALQRYLNILNDSVNKVIKISSDYDNK